MGMVNTKNLAVGVSLPDSANSVRVGATIKAVYVELWVLANSQQPASIILIVEKQPGNGQDINLVGITALHDYPNKKNIFYSTQGLVGDANTNPVPFLRQWIKIPKGKQRFGLTDRLQVTILSQTEDINICGLMIYKEYF